MESRIERSSSRALTASRLRERVATRGVSRDVDFCTLTDGTGSMSWCIEAVKSSAKAMFARVAERHPRVRMACGFYRDYDCKNPFQFYGGAGPVRAPRGAIGEQPDPVQLVLRQVRGQAGSHVGGEFVRRGEIARLQEFLDEAGQVEGNSTIIEALGGGLYHASRLPWRARHRVLVCTGDTASHGYSLGLEPALRDPADSIGNCLLGMTHEKILGCLKAARLRCYMVRCGDSPQAELQYRDIAEQTGGRFIDFNKAGDPLALLVTVEAAIEDAAGGDPRKAIESGASDGRIGSAAARLLLESFEDEK